MRRCRKLISMIVMMAMLATMTPYQALAAEPPSDAAAQEIQTVAEEEGQEQEQDTQETIPEDKKESDEGQEDLEEGGEAAPSEDPSEVTSGSDAVDNSSTEAVAEDADPENSDAGKSAQSTQETAAPEEPGAEASAEAPAETTAAQESTEETAAEQPMSFQGRSDSGVRVTAKAPAGAFGTPVTMTVCDARVDAATEAQILDTADGSRVLAAVDITFWDGEGNQVEPQRQITVTISAAALNEAEHLQVVHVDTLESGAVDRSSAPKQISSSSTGGDTVVLVTDEFSIYAVVDADTTESPALLTYSFYDGTGAKINVQILKAGETLYEPAVPATLANKHFVGWYEQGSSTAFTDFGTVSEVTESREIALTARYSDEFAHVIYHDTAGNVVRTDTVPVNSTVTVLPDSPIIAMDSLTLCHEGWSKTAGGTEDVSGSLSVGTQDISLYPIILEGHWVIFDSDGGTAINSQFIDGKASGEDQKAQKPGDPYKEGFTFAGWYADTSRTNPFDFNMPITAPTTVYAKWTPNDNTQYKVIYWIEYQSDIENDLWDYKMVARIVNQSTTGAETEYDPELIFKNPYKHKDYGYVLNKEKSETKTVAPDGSTVVNVYFDCQTRNISFTFPDRNGNNVTVSAQVKYSADMGFFWDEVASYNDLDYLLDGKHEFLLSPNAVSVDSLSDMKKMIFYADEAGTWRAVNFNLADRIFYETLEGVAPDGKEAVPNTSARIQGGYNTDDRLYYEVSRDYVFGGWAKGVVPGDPTGFSCFFKGSDGNYGYSTSGVKTIWYHNTYGYGLDGSRDPDKRYEFNNDPDGFMDIYFKRLKYELNFHENGGEDLENYEIYYEKKLAGYDPAVTDPEHYTVGVSTRTNPDGQVLTFAGWYTDFALTDPFGEFDFTMPAYNIDLYAKWAPITYTVTFDSNGGSAVPAVTDVEYSQRVVKPEDPTYDGHKFMGWTLDGRPFNFESGITQDITLVAQWMSVDVYPVIYDLNGGTGTGPKDNAKYYGDAGVVVLSPGADVTGPDGKVFLGWLADSDGLLYYPNSTVTMPAAPLTLTAQWGEAGEPVSLIYDFNYATYGITAYNTKDTSETEDGLPNNSKVTVSDFADFGKEPDGYAFLGWNTKADGSGEMIDPGDFIWIDGVQPLPNRLYAIWEKTSVPPSDPTPEPPSDPTPTPGPKDKPGTHGSKTGDETRLLTWSVTCLLAGTGLMMSILRLRRKRKHKS